MTGTFTIARWVVCEKCGGEGLVPATGLVVVATLPAGRAS